STNHISLVRRRADEQIRHSAGGVSGDRLPTPLVTAGRSVALSHVAGHAQMTRYPLTKRLYDAQGADREQVMLFDVGCSMGVVDRWNAFGDTLQAIGFD